MRDQKEHWDGIWRKFKVDGDRDRQIIKLESGSLRWKKIEKRVIDKYHSFKGLDVIEIGAGRGENALLFGLRGANVTLLDYSEAAMEKAKALFSNFNCKAQFIKADAFDIPGNLLNNFDISMSFGLAEHFAYPQRQQIFDAHFLLLKQNGLSFISIPNAFNLPYRVSLMAFKLCRKYKLLEIPFTRAELKKIVHLTGYRAYEIIGSSLLKDSFYFLFAQFVACLSKWKLMVDTTGFEIPTVFDDYFGYALILVGHK